MSAPPPLGGGFLAGLPAPSRAFFPEDLDAEARLMARTAQEFVRRAVCPARERLEAHDVNTQRRLMREAGALGLLGGNVPVEYGGLALPKTTAALVTESMAGDLSFAIGSGIHAGVALLPLVLFGTEAQKAGWLPRMATGETLGAFALSEANAGSDARSARARAVPSPDGTSYTLSGAKQWVTNAGSADLFTVFAQVDGTQFTAFLVPRPSPGVSLGPEEEKLGLRASSTRRLFLDDVRVPAEDVIGIVGQGHRPALCALNPGRFAIAVTALGASKEALRTAALYAGRRTQFGRALGSFGLIQQKLGVMAARVFALESMVFRTAGFWDRRPEEFSVAATEEYAIECALLKFWGTEALDFVVDEALQIHGGYGFSESYPIARLFRDARVFRLFEGTNEINRLTVLDQVFRRLRAGRLSLPLPQTACDPVGQIRQATLFVLRQVQAAVGDGWREAQEVMAALADMIAALYALESVALRCARLSGGNPAQAALELLTAELTAQAEQRAKFALAALAEGDTMRCHIGHLGALLEPPLRDTVRLHRALAEATLDRQGYPWG